MRKVENGQPFLLYRFKSTYTNQTYMVRVEEYLYHFYGVKFYLKAHAHSDQKYNLLTGFNEPRQLVRTILCMMIDIHKKDAKASFGFIGAETIQEQELRKQTGIEKMTKRMSFYRQMLNSYFPQEDAYYVHYIDEAKSTYLIINKGELKKDPELIQKINQYFSDNYSNFD